jgi:hypothetical protein
MGGIVFVGHPLYELTNPIRVAELAHVRLPKNITIYR